MFGGGINIMIQHAVIGVNLMNIYWALMANIGALDPQLTDKCDNSADELHLCGTPKQRYFD